MSDETVEEIKRKKLEELQNPAEQSSTDAPIEITSEGDLDELLASQPIVLVDCYADWCGPCKQLAPIVEQLAAETTATVAKIDTDSLPDLAMQFNVRALPTLLLFVDGELAERLMGLRAYHELEALIEQHSPN